MRVLTVAVYGPKSISPLPIRYTLVVAFHNGVSFTFRSIVQWTVKERGILAHNYY